MPENQLEIIQKMQTEIESLKKVNADLLTENATLKTDAAEIKETIDKIEAENNIYRTILPQTIANNKEVNAPKKDDAEDLIDAIYKNEDNKGE